MPPRGPETPTGDPSDSLGGSASEFARLARVDEVLTEELARVPAGETADASAIARRHPEIEAELRAALGGAIQLDRAVRASGSQHEELPRRLDNYALIRELGRGGMGVVAEAHDEELDRRVAVKVLPKSVSADEEYAARFQREAHAAARLEHPHVVPIYGVGEAGGQAYIAMKLVEGYGLDELIHELDAASSDSGASHPKPPSSGPGRRVARRLVSERLDRASNDPDDESSWPTSGASDSTGRLHLGANYHRNVAKIGHSIASALGYAHDRGVLHRDIKPGNILLDKRGHVWVADFGLAKLTESEDVTREGDFVGTLRYMAPEQFQGHAEPRSDTYALGLVLYEMLTLQQAVLGSDRAGLAYSVLHQDPKRPRSIRPEIPADLERIVMKACAKLQEERYRSAADLSADLRAYLDGRPIAARMPSALYLTRLAVNRNRTLFGAIAVLAGLLALSAFAYVTELRRSRAAESRLAYRSSLAAAGAALKVTDIPTAMSQLESCPPAQREWEWQHLMASLDQSTATYADFGEPIRQVYATEYGGQPTLAVTDRAAVSLISAAGTTRIPSPFNLDRDQHGLVHSHLWGDALYVLSAEDGLARIPLAEPSTFKTLRLGGGCEVFDTLPDASRALAVVRNELVVIDPQAMQAERRIWTGDATMRAASMSSDGSLAWSASLTGEIIEWDLNQSTSRIIAELPAQLTALSAYEPPADSAAKEKGLHPRWIAAGATDGAIYRLDMSVSPPHVHQLLGHRKDVYALAFSKDGRELVSGGEDKTVRLWDIQASELIQTMTGHSRRVQALLFDDERSRLVSGGRAGIVKTWDFGVSAGRNALGGHLADVVALDHTDDNLRFATGARDTTIRVHDAASQRLDSILIGHQSELNGLAWHPGSRWLTSTDRTGIVLHWDVDAGTSLWRAKVDGVGAGPVLSPDASTVFVGSTRGELVALDTATGQDRVRVRLADQGISSLALAPEGNVLLVGTFAGQLLEIDPKTLLTRRVHDRHRARIAGIDFSPGTDEVLTVGWDRRLVFSSRSDLARTEDLDLGGAEHSWATDALDDLDVSPDGRLCAVASHNWFVRLIEIPSRTIVLDLSAHTDWVRRVSFSPDGRSLVSTGSQAQVRVWDVHGTEERREAVAARMALEEAGAALVRSRLGRDLEDPADVEEGLRRLGEGGVNGHPDLLRAARGHLFQQRDAMLVEHWQRRLCEDRSRDLAIGARQYLSAQQRHERSSVDAVRLAALADLLRGKNTRSAKYVERARRAMGPQEPSDPVLEAIEFVLARRASQDARPPTWDKSKHPASVLRTAGLVLALPDAQD